MDIENSEWGAIPDMIESRAISDVSQLYLEFHQYASADHLRILRLLYEEGYRIFWYHQNPACRYDLKFVQYTLCHEVYFIRE